MNTEASLPLKFLNSVKKYYFSAPDLNKDHRTSGAVAWASLASAILVYDVLAIKSKQIETLTRAFWRLSEDSKNKYMLVGMWSILTAHLFLEKEARKTFEKYITK